MDDDIVRPNINDPGIPDYTADGSTGIDSDLRPTGFIVHDEPLTEEQYEDLKRRFLEAQKTQPIRVIRYPEIDYPQELRDQHPPMSIDHLIEQYEDVLSEQLRSDPPTTDPAD